ncbi:MAG: PDZ domain-containing protein [bacterium]|nr:PDZ domain-containing protein [Candidatus Kapabacteria bacterium]
MRIRYALLILFCGHAIPATSQQVPPPADSLIEHSLRMFDINPFEWSGTPDPLRPRLGVYTQEVPYDSLRTISGVASGTKGFRIWHLMPNWAADAGGLFIGDVILAVDGLPSGDSVYQADEFIGNRAREMRAGQTMTFTIVRDNTVRTVAVPLIVPERTPMIPPTTDRLGPIRAGSWLQGMLQSSSLTEWAKTIQRQMRIVADQEFSTVSFAGRPGPWRLSAVTYLHRAPTRVGAFSRLITSDIWNGLDSMRGLSGVVAAAALHLDVPIVPTASTSPSNIEEMRVVLDNANALVRRALSPINPNGLASAREIGMLLDMSSDWEVALENVADANVRRSTRIGEEQRIGALFAAADKIDRIALFDGATMLAALADSTLIDRIMGAVVSPKKIPRNTSEGEILQEWMSSAGRCVIGGAGANFYEGEYGFIFDIGGDDSYILQPALASTARVVIDVAGDDLYRADSSGQGSGIFSIDVLIDRRGNDVYRGTMWSQGAGVLGVGILSDLAGDDIYKSRWGSQGAAFHGIGILHDEAGADTYIAEVYSQGFGYVRGFGAIIEERGNDSYRAGWKYPDSRVPNRAHLSLSQGFGYGMRPWSTGVGGDGGIGVLTDRTGDDLYAADFFSQGCSYWYAIGILHDREGADRYTAGQYSQGSGIHLSFGALLDDAGDDMYDAYAGLEQGNAHDWSAGCLEDFQGNDTYRGSTSSQGSALTVSIAWLLDTKGNDQYFINPTDTTTSQGAGTVARLRGGGSLGMLVDLGKGSDYYVEPRVVEGRPLLKSNRGIVYDDGRK